MALLDSLNKPVQETKALNFMYALGFFVVFVLEYFAVIVGLVLLAAGASLKGSDQNTSIINEVLTQPMMIVGAAILLGTLISFPFFYNRIWRKITNTVPRWYANIGFVIIGLIPFIYFFQKFKPTN